MNIFRKLQSHSRDIIKVSVLLKASLNIVLRSLRFVILYVPSRMLANIFDKKYDDSPNNVYFMFGLVLKAC